jgi:hypothetical protein
MHVKFGMKQIIHISANCIRHVFNQSTITYRATQRCASVKSCLTNLKETNSVLKHFLPLTNINIPNLQSKTITNYEQTEIRAWACVQEGCAVAQAVSRWLPTAAARVRVRAACGVCGGQSGTGAGFLPSTSVSPANHSAIIIHHHNHPGLAQ